MAYEWRIGHVSFWKLHGIVPRCSAVSTFICWYLYQVPAAVLVLVPTCQHFTFGTSFYPILHIAVGTWPCWAICAQMCNFWLLGRSKDVSLGACASATSQHLSSSRSKKCTILHRGSIQEKWLVINVRVCARMVIIVVRHDLKIVSLFNDAHGHIQSLG